VADLIFSGGRVWTGVPGRPLAEALAVRDGRIAGVGRDDEVLPLAGSGTVLVPLEGRTLLPGFVDAHLHLVAGGYSLSQVALGEVESRQGLARRLESWAARLPEGQWITGGGWDHERWGGALPARDWIDAVTPDHPVLVHRLDLHMALANTRALERAGIDASTPDPPGGLLLRDGEGRLTGLLKDRAIDLVADRIPRADAAAREAAIRAAGRHLLARGVTQAHDMGTLGDSDESWQNLASYRSLRERDCLRLRVYAFVPLAHRARLADYVAEHGRGDAWLRWGGVKGFVDGSLGSGTAWMNEGFADEPGNRGLTLTDPDEIRRGVEEADAAGLHVAVHAIGDRANDMLLDAFQAAVRTNGPRDRRFRVEHAQHLSPGAVARFGEEGVVASVQPYHLADDGRWAARRLGPERTRRSWPLASLLAGGARLAFGSDWTVAPPDPVRALAAAVTRRTLDGAHPDGWIPEERIPLEAALRAHTGEAAWAGFMDGWTGRLVPGASADLVVLDRDLFALPAKEWTEACVEETVVEGRVEYRRGDEPQEEEGAA
jgi:hypothetical protein